jgi:hypothetical protein
VPTPPRRRRRGLIVLLVSVIVVVAAVGGFALYGALLKQTPRETTDKFLSAMKAKNFTAAHDSLCRDGRNKESATALRDAFELKDHTITTYTIDSERKTTGPSDGKVTAVSVTLTYENGDKINVEIDVVGESGGKVCGFKIPA